MRTPQEFARLREQAVALRRQGKSRRQIKEILGFASGEAAPGEGFEPSSDGTKTRYLAWLDHPGMLVSSLYREAAADRT
jgi:hypothetical protein